MLRNHYDSSAARKGQHALGAPGPGVTPCRGGVPPSRARWAAPRASRPTVDYRRAYRQPPSHTLNGCQCSSASRHTLVRRCPMKPTADVPGGRGSGRTRRLRTAANRAGRDQRRPLESGRAAPPCAPGGRSCGDVVDLAGAPMVLGCCLPEWTCRTVPARWPATAPLAGEPSAEPIMLRPWTSRYSDPSTWTGACKTALSVRAYTWGIGWAGLLTTDERVGGSSPFGRARSKGV